MERLSRIFVLSAGLVASTTLALAAEEIPGSLVLEKTYFVQGEGRFQPSGLAIHDGEIWTVSDKHGLTAFRLDLHGDIALAVPAVKGSAPAEIPPGVTDFDVEGVEFHEGRVYIASEEASRIYCLSLAEPKAIAVTPDLAEAVRDVGLFARSNAGIEAFTVLDNGHFLVAVEREPRGLIEIDPTVSPPQIRGQVMESTRYWRRRDAALDFAGLTVWNGRVFALARSQGLVVELVRAEDGRWEEGSAWSFYDVENRPDLRYRNRKYGMAEGLAIDATRVLVIFDNNDDGREAAPDDHRPQLFVFKNPFAAG